MRNWSQNFRSDRRMNWNGWHIDTSRWIWVRVCVCGCGWDSCSHKTAPSTHTPSLTPIFGFSNFHFFRWVRVWHPHPQQIFDFYMYSNSGHENKFILLILDLLLILWTKTFFWGLLLGKWSWHNKKICFHRNSYMMTVTLFSGFSSKFLAV
jgi:hypothetical protein